jgi:cytochrome c
MPIRKHHSRRDRQDRASEAAPTFRAGLRVRSAQGKRRRSVVRTIGREIADHPSETAALMTMVIALWRLLPASGRDSPTPPLSRRGNRRLLSPVSVMAALCILGLAGCGLLGSRVVKVHPDPLSYGSDYPDDFADAGRKIAQERCASCHAIDQAGASGANAPPMDTLLLRYDADRLADNLIAGNRVGHDGMAAFDFNVTAAVSLVAYLESIRQDATNR